MKKKKIKNPLIRRITKELIGDWKKYLFVLMFLVIKICFVSGMYYLDEAKKKLDKKLPKKFKEKFDEKFPDKFKKEFDKKFP